MLSFTIWITNRCNLACKYCYEKDNVNRSACGQAADIDQVIDFIKKKADYYKKDDISVSFHGGEPLLQYGRIRAYIEGLRTIMRDRRVSFFLTTNGLLLDREKAEYLTDHLDELSVSIDGCEEAHDLNRVYPNGQRSYREVMNHIEQSGLDKRKLRVRMTVTANNVAYLADGVESLVNQEFRCIVPAVAIEDPDWTEERFRILEEELIKMKKKYGRENVCIAMIDQREMRIKTACSGGIKSFNIMPNGDVYPCEYVAGNRAFLLGNVADLQVDEEALRKLYGQAGCSDCQECTYGIYCEGVRCKYINVINTGDFHMPPDAVCEVENIKYRVYQYKI